MTRSNARRGGVAADVLLTLAVLSLFLALVYPWFARVRFQSRVDAAVSDVDAVEAAALQYHDLKGMWPPDGQTGVAPVELRPFLAAGLRMTRPRYRLRWDHWQTVAPPAPVAAPPPPPAPDAPQNADSIPVPEPRFGTVVGVTVYTADASLLAALLDHYGAGRSFVRDSSWTLVLTPPAS